MKRHIFYISAMFLIAGAGFLALRSCNAHYKRNVSELKGQHEAYKKTAEEKEKKSQETIVKKEMVIAEKDKDILRLKKDIEFIYNESSEKGKEIKELNEELKGLTDKDKIISNLKSQVKAWSERFAIAQNIIAKKDEIIFSLTEKYEAQLVISKEWEEMYNTERSVRLKGEERIEVLEFEIGRLSFGSRVKTYAAAALAAYFGYKLFFGGGL